MYPAQNPFRRARRALFSHCAGAGAKGRPPEKPSRRGGFAAAGGDPPAGRRIPCPCTALCLVDDEEEIRDGIRRKIDWEGQRVRAGRLGRKRPGGARAGRAAPPRRRDDRHQDALHGRAHPREAAVRADARHQARDFLRLRRLRVRPEGDPDGRRRVHPKTDQRRRTDGGFAASEKPARRGVRRKAQHRAAAPALPEQPAAAA